MFCIFQYFIIFFNIFSIYKYTFCPCTKLDTVHSRLAESVVLSVLEEIVLAVVPEEGGAEVCRQAAPLLCDRLGGGIEGRGLGTLGYLFFCMWGRFLGSNRQYSSPWRLEGAGGHLKEVDHVVGCAEEGGVEVGRYPGEALLDVLRVAGLRGGGERINN